MPKSRTTVSPDRLASICGWLGVLTLVAGVWTTSAANLHTRRALPQGVTSPTIALELIRDPAVLDQIARTNGRRSGLPPRDERAILARGVRVDFVFIAAYTAFLVAVALFAWTVLPYGAVLGLAIAGTGIAAAVFDVREHLAMLALLAGDLAARPRPESLAKWTLVFIALLGSSFTLIDASARPFRRTLGQIGFVITVFVAWEGIFGVARADDKLIEAAAGRAAEMIAIAAVFFLTRRALRDGVLPALDRFARLKWMAKLAEWPSCDQNETVGESVYDATPAT